MGITVKEDKLFALNTKNTSYVFFLDDDGILVQLYWGRRIDRLEDFDTSTMTGEQGYHPNTDKKREECSSYGMMRYKEASMKLTFYDGVRDFRYRVKGWDVEEDHLQIVLEDIYYPLQIILHYRVYEDQDIIEKWREARNAGDEQIRIERFYSGEYTLPGEGYRSINFNGTWADEFKPYEDSLCAGKKVYESLRGATAHVANPVFIVHKNADETQGEVWFGALAYSGNFKVVEEQTPYCYLNIQIGLSDTDFCWILGKGETFRSPSVYAGYSDAGFGSMSQKMHRFAHECVMPDLTAKKPLRIIYNSWEATAFDVTCSGQMELARRAARAGAELFVVDDGWFGQRHSDHRGLGDWYVNPEKFPQGLKPLIDCVKALGMDFGIWIEPEMVNEDSDLYRAHPDWIYRYETREVLEGRYQYMLDLTNPAVVDHLIGMIDRLLSENDISYIKWDMNRALGECGSAHLGKEEFRSIWFRHVKGFYKIIEEMRKRHPKVEFEACASGGGRVDFGCLSRFDEFWVSDNTDPLDRLEIQEAYTLIYPPKYMRAWITDAADNEKRRVPFSFKAHCAMCGALGIGMDLNLADGKRLDEVSQYVQRYKEIRHLVQFGRLERLKSGKKDGFYAIQYTKGGESVLFLFRVLRPRGEDTLRVKLRGLDERGVYSFKLQDERHLKSGAYLMYNGLEWRPEGDYSSSCILIKREEGNP